MTWGSGGGGGLTFTLWAPLCCCPSITSPSDYITSHWDWWNIPASPRRDWPSAVASCPIPQPKMLWVKLWIYCEKAKTSPSVVVSSLIIQCNCTESSVKVNGFTRSAVARPAFSADSNLKTDRGSKIQVWPTELSSDYESHKVLSLFLPFR